jgi:hypothetical protein
MRAFITRASSMTATAVTAAAFAATMLAAYPAAAQSLQDRELAAPAPAVRISFDAREGVCGPGYSFNNGARSTRDWRNGCEPGPVRVQFEKLDGRISALRSYVGGEWLPREDTVDLGAIAAPAAAEYLLDLASSASAPVAENALQAAVLADAPDPWPTLLAIARDGARNASLREKAVFWLGQSAAREATRGLAAIVDDADETTAVQKAAVFALARRNDPERIDLLVRAARTHSNPEVVKAAFFWLAESEDARVIDLFEEILTGSARTRN